MIENWLRNDENVSVPYTPALTGIQIYSELSYRTKNAPVWKFVPTEAFSNSNSTDCTTVSPFTDLMNKLHVMKTACVQKSLPSQGWPTSLDYHLAKYLHDHQFLQLTLTALGTALTNKLLEASQRAHCIWVEQSKTVGERENQTAWHCWQPLVMAGVPLTQKTSKCEASGKMHASIKQVFVQQKELVTARYGKQGEHQRKGT